MATKEEFIDRLNTALSWELAGLIQYMQHSVMVTGALRESMYEFFHEGSEEARDHAELAGNRIAALGAIPTVEPARIRQATDVEGMLEAALALEVDALAAWEDALAASDAVAPGYQFWLEEQIAEEQEHVDDLRKMTNKVSFADSDVAGGDQKSG
jgi:bacterioferritin (cytochrome b1)